MSLIENLHPHFLNLKSRLFQELRGTEELAINLEAEDTLYIRWNNSRVRQNTQVEQARLEMIFQNNQRRFTTQFDLSGNLETDFLLAQSMLERSRKECEILAPDPGVSPFVNRGQSHDFQEAREFSLDDFLKLVKSSTPGTDFTGLSTSGPQVRANANSLGQQHWFSNRSFFIDYSLYTLNEDNENKAVKAGYADREFSADQFLNGLSQAQNQISLLKRPSKSLKPGAYRTYLAPAAFSELVGMLSWKSLSYAAYRQGNCSLAELKEGKQKLSPLFHLRENFDLGLTTPFNNLGEVPPRQLDLIVSGELKNMLVSSKAAQEYGLTSNFAEINSWGSEYLRSPEVLPGTLEESRILKELGTGLYIGNLHYLNWSDLQKARITGMTRYACFWVENGEIVAPIHDLRFDESLYSTLGSSLEALTQAQVIDPNVDTYVKRPLGGKKVPGALIREFQFTL